MTIRASGRSSSAEAHEGPLSITGVLLVWPGRTIAIGDVRIRAEKLRDRCVMTTYDPDTLERDPSVLLRIVKQLDGCAALDCSVISGGIIRVGDAVEIVPDS